MAVLSGVLLVICHALLQCNTFINKNILCRDMMSFAAMLDSNVPSLDTLFVQSKQYTRELNKIQCALGDGSVTCNSLLTDSLDQVHYEVFTRKNQCLLPKHQYKRPVFNRVGKMRNKSSKDWFIGKNSNCYGLK